MSDGDAFRVYAADSPQMARTILGRLRKRREDEAAAALDAQDWPDFVRHRGILDGLDTAIALCEQMEREQH